MDKFENVISIFNAVVTIITIFSIVIKFILWVYQRLVRQIKITWRSIYKGVQDLAGKVEDLQPEILVTLSGKGSIVCNWINSELDNKYPVYTCLLNRRGNDNFLTPPNWECFSTNKWIIYVPDEVLHFKNKKILFIDDVTISGETLAKFKQFLTNNGVKEERIFTMTLYANSKITSKPYKYWKEKNMKYYNPPWGKSR